MNDNNKHQNNSDVVSPEQADKTWSDLESGDRLGQAVKDSLDSRLPESDPKLREALLARMPMESPLDKVSVRSNAPAGGSGRMLLRWVLAAGILVGLASIAWLGQQQYDSYSMSKNEEMATSDNPARVTFVPSTRPRSLFSRGPGDASTESSILDDMYKNDLPDGVVAEGSAETPYYFADDVTIQQNAGDVGGNMPRVASSGSPFGGTAQEQGGISVGQFEQQGRALTGMSGDPGFRPEINLIEGLAVHDRRTDDLEYFDPSRNRRDRADNSSSGEQYDAIYENQFLSTQGLSALSTFSVDVDTASYANIRRFLTAGQFPPPNAVRIEEMVNYFQYEYPQPTGDVPFSVNMEVATCPWNAQHRLLRIGLKGKEIHRAERPVSNLVFLLDVSGSMSDADKLPLLKRGLQMMVDQLGENDRVTIVTYAGNAGLVLPPTRGDQKQTINAAIDNLQSGGSTHGSAGISLAYQLATENFIEGGTNRVIWATDGDLNVGVTGDQQLVDLVSSHAKGGVFLTVLGFGTGNLKDSKMEKIADKGNGMYAYIDSMREARKVLVEQMSGSLITIAKDVKLQLEFNPGQVAAYRLIGYENRMLATEDFDDDGKDAGEIGAGHTVTALYELVPANGASAQPAPVNLKYQTSAVAAQANDDDPTELSDAANNGDLLTLALRYKAPESSESTKVEFTVADSGNSFESASSDFRFAASVASFGMVLRGSKYRGNSSVQLVEQIASSALGSDLQGYRAEFVDLVRRVNRR